MLIVPAYAKLNLALEVIARRDDGLHDIDSLIVRIDWHDVVGVALQPADAVDVALRVTGPAATGVPAGDDNLAERAARAVLERASEPLRVQLWLDKRVPHAAGLGGGSADAAATLRAVASLMRRRGTSLDAEALERIALQLGSDIPVTLAPPGAYRVRGRGEQLMPVATKPLHVAVLVAGASSTAQTFAGLAPDEMSDGGRISALSEQLSRGGDHADLYGSALETAARRASPELSAAMERARSLLPERAWHMTGSGGALFCVVPDGSTAAAVAQRARDSGFVARACRTLDAREGP